MRHLMIDIETSPMLGYVWGLWQQNVGLSQIAEHTEVICFAAKWYGERAVEFRSIHGEGGKDAMIQRAHELLDQADAVTHYNGRRFDIPHLNREFLEAKLGPPSPFKQIDLLQTVKRQFRFPSNKLEYVSQRLGLAGKVKHEGFTLWLKFMAGDPKAIRDMKRYNVQDVRLLEDVYNDLKPWIVNHPNAALYLPAEDLEGGELRCPTCATTKVIRSGWAYTNQTKRQRYRCQAAGCGRWFQSGKRVSAVDGRPIAV